MSAAAPARAVPRVLSIAGTDPTGGAGVQADVKSIAAHGGYAMAVVTCLVAQNTQGVRDVHVPPAAFLTAQLDAVSDDVDIDAVKLGMLHSAPLIDAVSSWLDRVRPPVVVLDPVMVASSGDRLLDDTAVTALRALCGRVDLVTPNLPELAVLTSQSPATTWDDAVVQARSLAAQTGATVLLKGGHLPGQACPDAIVTANEITTVPGIRVDSPHTHGTGCSMSSALATQRAHGLSWIEALPIVKAWLTGAIAHAGGLRVGRGRGPIDHFHAHREPDSSWSRGAWREVADVRAEIDGCPFVQRLEDGTLPTAAFDDYLTQDAIYLREYSRVLARLSVLATDEDEQAFWATGAHECLVVERRLHTARIGDATHDPAPVTRAYVDHLLALSATAGYAELAAAVLPCYWLYQDLGTRLSAAARTARRDTHPYADWLRTYDDPGFAESTRRAIAVCDRVAAAADAQTRARMTSAFRRSADLELAFFEAPLVRWHASAAALAG